MKKNIKKGKGAVMKGGIHFNSEREVGVRISGAKTQMCKSTTMYTPRSREEASSYLAIWGKKRAEHSRQLATWLRRERGLEYSKQLHQQVQRP